MFLFQLRASYYHHHRISNSSYFDELEAQNLGRTRTPLKEKFRRYGSFALHKWNATHFVHTPSSLVQCLLDLESTFICQRFEFTKHLYMHSSDGLICTSEIAFASYFVAQVFYIFFVEVWWVCLLCKAQATERNVKFYINLLFMIFSKRTLFLLY